MVRTNQLLI